MAVKFEDYVFYASDINRLEEMLSRFSEDEELVVERMGLESRLKRAKARIAGVERPPAPKKASIVFHGAPVCRDGGLAADFGIAALSAFTDAVTTMAAGCDGRLDAAGPVPRRAETRPVIMGFHAAPICLVELEIQRDAPPEAARLSEQALHAILELFRLSADGSDAALAAYAASLHPRAVRQTAEFLALLPRSGAWCGLHFLDRQFHYADAAQQENSAHRLAALTAAHPYAPAPAEPRPA